MRRNTRSQFARDQAVHAEIECNGKQQTEVEYNEIGTVDGFPKRILNEGLNAQYPQRFYCPVEQLQTEEVAQKSTLPGVLLFHDSVAMLRQASRPVA